MASPAVTAFRAELEQAARDLAPMLRRAPAYTRLALRLFRDGHLEARTKWILAGAAVYAASPINAIPGFIPILGQLDDVIVALSALRLGLDRLGSARAAAHLEAAGVRRDDLDRDIVLARRALRALALTAGVAALDTGARGLRAAARWVAGRLRPDPMAGART